MRVSQGDYLTLTVLDTKDVDGHAGTLQTDVRLSLSFGFANTLSISDLHRATLPGKKTIVESERSHLSQSTDLRPHWKHGKTADII